MIMINHLDIGSSAWSGKATNLPEQGGAQKTGGLFQQLLDRNIDSPLETLTPDTIRALAENLISALDRAGMHGMFFDLNERSNQATGQLLSTDLLMSIRHSAKTPMFAVQGRPVHPVASIAVSHEPVTEVQGANQNDENPVSGKDRFASIIASAAASNGLDPKLIEAVIRTESNFDAQAVSPVGAQGLMQLMPATAAELGVSDAFDPEQNIQAGSKYLKRLMDRYDGDTGLALAAYNWGMGNLERHPQRMPQETVNYVAKITGLMRSPDSLSV